MLGARMCKVVRGVLQDKDWKAMFGLMGVALSFAWVAVFSHSFYPNISFSVGGGRPRDVVFVLNEPAQQSAATSFLVRRARATDGVLQTALGERGHLHRNLTEGWTEGYRV
jgi:hypothetical protein